MTCGDKEVTWEEGTLHDPALARMRDDLFVFGQVTLMAQRLNALLRIILATDNRSHAQPLRTSGRRNNSRLTLNLRRPRRYRRKSFSHPPTHPTATSALKDFAYAKLCTTHPFREATKDTSARQAVAAYSYHQLPLPVDFLCIECEANKGKRSKYRALGAQAHLCAT